MPAAAADLLSYQAYPVEGTMSRIPILQLIYQPGASIDRVVAEYGRSLDRTRYHHTVAYLFGAPDETLAARLHADRVVFCQLPRREWTGLRLRALWRLGRLLREGNYRLVVCHRYKAMRLLGQWGRCGGLPPVLFVIHSLGYLQPRARRWAARWGFPGVRYVAISRAVRDDILQSLPWLAPDTVAMVPNTLDPDATHLLPCDVARQRLDLPTDAFVFGSVGRLVPFKDHETLIRAFIRVARELPHSHLLIMGDGPLVENLRRLRDDSGLRDRIHLPGHVAEAASLMAALDVFVLSSRNEPFGLVLLEAMAAGLPVISSVSGGAGEIIHDDFALAVTAHDPAGFGEALRTLYHLSDGERAARGQRARRHLLQRFTRSRFPVLLPADHAPSV